MGLLNVEYLLSASVSQTVLTENNIDVESMQNSLQSAIVVNDVVAATSSIETVSCDTDGTCAPASVQSTSESGGGGSSAGIIIVVLLLLLGGGGAGYYFYTQQKPDNDIEMMEADGDAGDDAV